MEGIQSSVTPQPSSGPDVSTNQQCPPPETTQLGDIASPDEKPHPPQLVEPDDNWDMREYFQERVHSSQAKEASRLIYNLHGLPVYNLPFLKFNVLRLVLGGASIGSCALA